MSDAVLKLRDVRRTYVSGNQELKVLRGVNLDLKAGEIVEKNVPVAGLLTFTYVRDPEGNIIELQNWS